MNVLRSDAAVRVAARIACLTVTVLWLGGHTPIVLGEAEFPRKPIEIIVYTRPGGLIDITARKFVMVAKNHVDVDVTFVVVNKPGSGGIAAIEKMLRKPADGHMILACTKSNIAKIVQSNREPHIDAIDWMAMMMKDPECIITRAADQRSDFRELIADARARPSEQNWLGPASGGLDHVMALKTWDQFDIQAKWIPFGSGGEAKAWLLGKIGVAYVGNPRDAADNEDLQISVVSSPSRLDQFPHTPVFSEFGVNGLDNQFMWRGFAIKKGCPKEALRWYATLFRDVTNDKEWRRFWEKDGIEVIYYDNERFTKLVKDDQAEFSHYLSRLDMINTEPSDGQRPNAEIVVAGLIVLVIVVLVAALIRRGRSNQLGYYLIPSLVLSLGILFVAHASSYPVTVGVGAGAMPRLWTYLMIPLIIVVFGQTRKDGEQSQELTRQSLVTMEFALLVIAYIALTVYFGYYVATLAFLLPAMYLLGLRDLRSALTATAAWLVFTYLVFTRLLRVSPPVGHVFERIL